MPQITSLKNQYAHKIQIRSNKITLMIYDLACWYYGSATCSDVPKLSINYDRQACIMAKSQFGPLKDIITYLEHKFTL